MRRERRNAGERRIARSFAALEREIPIPPDQELRSLARNASSGSRPLPSPARARPWPLQSGWTGVLVLAFVVAVGLGVGFGALIAPSGTAARGPIGVGFLPEPGWFVLQSGHRSVGQPAVAIAANVPLHPDDDVRGLAESSALPYATLQTLPPDGVVIAAAFSRRGESPIADPFFRRKRLPLDVRDAVWTRYGRALRDGELLGQYQLRAAVDDENVDLIVYFGRERPAQAQLDEAQRQLSGLVVRSPSKLAGANASVVHPAESQTVDRTLFFGSSSTSRIVDRTFACTPIVYGGVRDLDLWASPPRTDPWIIPAYLVARTGTTLPDTDLVFVRARTQGRIGLTSPREGPAGVYASARRCVTTRAAMPLTSQGLPGPPAGWFSEVSCSLRGRVLVRVRARLAAPAEWRRVDRSYFGAQKRIEQASIAVRSERTGEPLAFMQVDKAGKTRLWTAPRCR